MNHRHGPTVTDADIRTDLPTRAAVVKWVTVVDPSLDRGALINAAVCTAAAVAHAVPVVIGPGADDALGTYHPGLPWLGCSVLAADAATLRDVRARAISKPSVFVADMADIAQHVRVYDGYLERLAKTEVDDLSYIAVSLIGPRNVVDKLVGKLPLLR